MKNILLFAESNSSKSICLQVVKHDTLARVFRRHEDYRTLKNFKGAFFLNRPFIMKQYGTVLLFLFLFLPAMVFSQQEEKNPDISWNVYGVVLMTNNGFAPIPAFSFERPTVMAFLSFEKHRFRYQPDTAFGFDGDLWVNNHWFRYRLIENERFVLNGGVNVNLFFLHETGSSGQEIIRTNRNLNVEVTGDILMPGNLALRMMYRYNYAADPQTVTGHLIDMTAQSPDISITGPLFLNLRPQLFYFDHIGNMDGFFTSVFTSAGHKNIPLSLFFQGVYRIWSNFKPSPIFQWNAGVQYVF